jgi:hypothetical protein
MSLRKSPQLTAALLAAAGRTRSLPLGGKEKRILQN